MRLSEAGMTYSESGPCIPDAVGTMFICSLEAAACNRQFSAVTTGIYPALTNYQCDIIDWKTFRNISTNRKFDVYSSAMIDINHLGIN